MDWTHAHLALNHIPVIGTPFLFLLLAWGILTKTSQVVRLALWWTAGFSVVFIALKFTGDFAAEQAGAQLDPLRVWVNAHEQMADQATTAVFLGGISAALALFLGRKGRAIPVWALALVLAVGFASTVMLARTANSGGKIRHPNLRDERPVTKGESALFLSCFRHSPSQNETRFCS